MIQFIEGDIREATETYLCHQCNCITTKAAHLAKDIFCAFPYANVYAIRTSKDNPGTIRICGDGVHQRFVVNMFAQVYPGSPKYPNSDIDGSLARQKYFRSCLSELAKAIKPGDTVAFPWRIGCGAAGGDWNVYLYLISMFADDIDSGVVVYRKGERN